jgi:hypothetical protein
MTALTHPVTIAGPIGSIAGARSNDSGRDRAVVPVASAAGRRVVRPFVID